MNIYFTSRNVHFECGMQADSENTRMIHEAYQFLTAKKKKKSGRSMVQVDIIIIGL